MSHAYTPGLQVAESLVVSKTRDLPLRGQALVRVGQTVEATTSVLAADLPGELVVVKVSSRMGLEPEDILPGLKVTVGQTVSTGDLLCETKSFFGFFTSILKSPVSGVIEFFTEANAHLGIRLASTPLTVNAYISGRITEIEEGQSVTIETRGSLIQGIFGVGGERRGKILALPVDTSAVLSAPQLEKYKSQMQDAVVIGGASFDYSALEFCAKCKVSGVVTGSIDPATLRNYVGYDISVSITGDEVVPFTLIITEGFGNLPMSERISSLAKKLQGKLASINGATQVRAGALRPEIIVPQETSAQLGTTDSVGTELRVGSSIRLIRVPYFGELGSVTELPSEPVKIATGAHVRILKAKLRDGREVIVPRANIELV